MRLPPNMQLGAGDAERNFRDAATYLYEELTRRYDGQDGPPLSFVRVNEKTYHYSAFGYEATREVVEDLGTKKVGRVIADQILLEFKASDLKGPLVWRVRPVWEAVEYSRSGWTAAIYFRCALVGGGDPTKLTCHKPEGQAPKGFRL